jgi:hypothetical protein
MSEIEPAAALYAFVGWLTSRRRESGPFSSRIEVHEAVALVSAFCESQGWEIKDPNWHKNLRSYPDR